MNAVHWRKTSADCRHAEVRNTLHLSESEKDGADFGHNKYIGSTTVLTQFGLVSGERFETATKTKILFLSNLIQVGEHGLLCLGN